ncbi:hypothetical protein MTO96_041839 [Rhipicephalus appendiculatus]
MKTSGGQVARQERLTAHRCATMCSAVEKDIAANSAAWDRNYRGPGSGYCTLAGAPQQASSLDLGWAAGTGPGRHVLSNARLRNAGAEARLRLSSSLPHVPPELIPSFAPLLPLFSCTLRATCTPLVFISFGFHFHDASKSLTFTTHA